MPNKAPEVSNADKVQKYQKQLKSAGEYYDKNFVKRADRMANMYEINHYYDEGLGKTTKATRDRIKVAYPYSNVRQIHAEIYSGLPEPVVKSEQKEQKADEPQDPTMQQDPTAQVEPTDKHEGAETLKGSIQYVIRRSNMEEAVNMMGLDGIATGIGIVGLEAQKTTNIPKYVRHLYRNIIADWCNVSDVYQSDWIACKLVRPLDEIHNDESYSEKRTEVRAAKLDTSIYGNTEIDYGVLWVWHNKKTNEYCIFPDDQPFTLVEKKLSDIYDLKVVSDDFVVDWPFVFFIDEEMILSPFGLGDIFPSESQVRELDKTRTQQVNHRKRFNRKYGYQKGVIDAQGINQLKNPDDGTMIEFLKPITPDNFQVISDAPMSADVYHVDQIIQNDIQIIGPLGPNSLVHGVGQAPDTLGQSQIIEQSSNTRLAAKQRKLAKTIARLYKLTAQFIQQYWVEENELLITGDGSRETDWLSFSPDKIKGEYDYDVVPESMKDNSVVYRKQASDALQIVTPLLPVAQQDPAVAVMIRKYLETFDTFKKDLDTIIPPELMQPKPQEPQAPKPDIPNISMATKDFPIPVQIKILALAGIQATPEDWQLNGAQPMQPGQDQSGIDPHLQELMKSDPQGFVDALQNMDPHEKQAILDHIGLGHMGDNPSQGQTPAVQDQGAMQSPMNPTEQSITQGVTAQA